MCGGKGASLGRLASTGKVPPGFNLSVNAFQRWMTAGGADIPGDLASDIRNAYARLEEISDTPNLPVAVRSSAIDEDGSGESFAGQYDTFLNVIGADSVSEAVVRCWRSLGNHRAMEYRNSRAKDTSPAPMAVVVQQLIFADVSAVAFSANPITGDKSEVVINANYGLGEAVVGGSATPDTFVVSKDNFSQQTLIIGSKEVMTVRTPHGTEEKKVPRIMREMPALTSEQAAEIAEMACRLENTNGWPVDLECAFQGPNLYLLQCRPITTL